MLLNLTDFSSEPLQDQIAAQIVEKILQGELDAGEEISPIGWIARQQHVSKKTVRKAFNYLESAGLIEYKNELGYFVKKLTGDQRENLFSGLNKITQQSGAENPDFYSEALRMRKLEEDLLTARQLQADLLPHSPILKDDISISGYIEPSRVVCGDFYDHFFIDENKIGLVIADASGKGMPAALLISQIQAILKSEIGNGSGIVQVMRKLNHHLVQNCSAKNFTTLFYGIYNINEETLEYINAGHNLPVLVNNIGSFELLKTTGPALGLIANFYYETNKIKIESGESILFYTDGITETMNGNGEQFGEGLLIKMLLEYSQNEIEEIINRIIAELNDFKSNNFMQDDKTLMLFKRKNSGKSYLCC